MRTLLRTLLSLCMLLAFASVSPAQTPDGTTPAVETICDTEVGAAYGLCNAFCEAMDCETDAPQASAIACDKVKGKYQQITGHEPPCLAPACPCIEQVPGFLAGANGPIEACIDDSDGDKSIVGLFADGGLFTSWAATEGGPAACGLGEFSEQNLILITEEELQACQDFLRAKAAAASVVCSSGSET